MKLYGVGYPTLALIGHTLPDIKLDNLGRARSVTAPLASRTGLLETRSVN